MFIQSQSYWNFMVILQSKDVTLEWFIYRHCFIYLTPIHRTKWFCGRNLQTRPYLVSIVYLICTCTISQYFVMATLCLYAAQNNERTVYLNWWGINNTSTPLPLHCNTVQSSFSSTHVKRIQLCIIEIYWKMSAKEYRHATVSLRE